MARKYAKLYVEIWEPDNDFRELSGEAQRLYLMLCSLPQLSQAGTILLQPRRWAMLAADATVEKIDAALVELVERGKVLVDYETDEVLVRAYIRRDGGLRTPNIRKAIRTAIDRIESSALRQTAEREFQRALIEHDIGNTGRPHLQAVDNSIYQGREGLPEPLAEGFPEGLPEGLPQGLAEGLR